MANEKWLIDVNAVVEKLEYEIETQCAPVADSDSRVEAFIKRVLPKLLRDVIKYLKQQPTVDAVEVVHGEWVWDVETHGDPMYGIDEDFGYRCSQCQVWAAEYGVDGDIYEEPPTHILHYCPNCGACMDGKSNVPRADGDNK